MSLTLTKYPVYVESGTVYNIFAGFQNVNLEFERNDINIDSVGSGTDNKIAISINATDLTADLLPGDWIYIYSQGATYLYNKSYKIITIELITGTTVITVDGDFIEVTTATGFINYKQEYSVEVQLINIDNANILEYPNSIESTGKPNGEISMSISSIVDQLISEIRTTSGELTDSRIKFRIKYREVWRDNESETFTINTDDPIIIIYASKDSIPEKFVGTLEEPIIWDGYPFFINFLHSPENLGQTKKIVTFDQLDINKDDLIDGGSLETFGISEYGILQTNFADNVNPIDADTQYIKFEISTESTYDYETGDYNDNDYFTENTP